MDEGIPESPPDTANVEIPFIRFFWFITLAFIFASVIGAVVLLASTPGCEDVYASSAPDCTVRHQYMFFTWGSIASAGILAVVLCAIGVALEKLESIDGRLQALTKNSSRPSR